MLCLKEPIIDLRVAGAQDITDLECLVQLAYRGGLASVSWKNEDHLVKGPRITATELESLLQDESTNILVGQNKEGKLVGCILVEKKSDQEAYIGLLAVHPDCQNSGLGRMLIQAAERHATEHFDSQKITMQVLCGREELLAWYQRLGYEKTGEKEPFMGPESGVIPQFANAHFVIIRKEINRKNITNVS